jgi:chitodextrinase
MLGFSAISEAPVSYVALTAGSGTPVPDVVVPAFTGTLASAKTVSSITVDWSATTSSDNVAVARREYRLGGSGAYTAASTAEETSRQHTFTGLAAGTTYLAEVRCVDTSGNVSAPLSIQVTTTTTTQADTIPPNFTGTLSVAKTSSSITVDWSGTTSSDNTAVARREYRIGGSGTYTPASSQEESGKQHTFTGLAPSTVYQVEVRCVDTSGNASQALAIGVATSAAPAPGGDGWSHIRLPLVSRGLVPHKNLGIVEWALFAQLSPKDFRAPVAQGVHQMPAGSPLLDIAVPADAVPAGWYSFVMSDPDGTTTAATRVLVSR